MELCSKQKNWKWLRQFFWINNDINSSLEERSKLKKIYSQKTLRKSDHIKVLENQQNVLRKSLKIKNTIITTITKMSIKFEDSNKASKTYWVILNRLVYNKTIPAIPPLLIDGSFVLDYRKKGNILICFCFYMHTYKKQ